MTETHVYPLRRRDNCPMCGRPFPPKLVVSGPCRQRLVNLVAGRPDGITRAELLDLIYASDPTGGYSGNRTPNVISVLVHWANLQLAPQGWHIRSTRGPGARYYLEQKNGDPVRQCS